MRVQKPTAAEKNVGFKTTGRLRLVRFFDAKSRIYRTLSALARPLLIEMRQYRVRADRMRMRETIYGLLTDVFRF